MTGSDSDNGRFGQPGTARPSNGDRLSTDAAHQGAKPAAFPADAAWFAAGSDGTSAAGANAAMSELLARNWWAVALRGVFALLFGAIALLLPGITIGALVLLFAAYMIVDGVFAIVSGIRAASHHQRWGALVLEGIVDLAAGTIAFFWPLATVLAFVFLAAAWAIVSGIVLLAATFRLHPAHGRWLMGLGGAVSLIWGILLVVAPITGAVALTWWMGVYALFFGGALIALAVRLRARRGHFATGGAIHSPRPTRWDGG
jgi:uncharacterized membrane protein HdeD (DUF308 family)